MKHMKGFTVTELVISMAIFGLLIGIITINLTGTQQKVTLSSTVETLFADLSQQQLKSMVGDTEGRAETAAYGIHFDSTKYTLFHGAYSAGEPTNFDITLPSVQQITTSPGTEIIFVKGSGEISGFSQSASTITLRDTVSGEEKIIELNRYGVVTGVN